MYLKVIVTHGEIPFMFDITRGTLELKDPMLSLRIRLDIQHNKVIFAT